MLLSKTTISFQVIDCCETNYLHALHIVISQGSVGCLARAKQSHSGALTQLRSVAASGVIGRLTPWSLNVSGWEAWGTLGFSAWSLPTQLAWGSSQRGGLSVISGCALGLACTNMSELILCVSFQPCIQCCRFGSWKLAIVEGSIFTMKMNKYCKSGFFSSLPTPHPQTARLPAHEFIWRLAPGPE